MKLRILALALSALLASASAEAYEVFECYVEDFDDPEYGDIVIEKSQTNGVSYYADPQTFGYSAPAYALVIAAATFNLNPSKARIDNLHLWNSGTGSIDNGRNDIYLTDNPNRRFLLWIVNKKCEIIENDLRFNVVNDTWHLFLEANQIEEYGGSSQSFISRALSGFVRRFGLWWTDDVVGLMNSGPWNSYYRSSQNGGVLLPHVGEDVATGLVDLYGKHPDNNRDVAVSHWRANKERLWEGLRTRLFCPSGGCKRIRNPDGSLQTGAMSHGYSSAGDGVRDPLYTVYRGQDYRAEFTYENLGAKDVETVDIAFYLSQDNTIDTGDTRIDTHRYNLRRDVPWTTKHTITIPSNYPTGRAYLGVIVDYNNKIPEAIEYNNATYTELSVY